MPIVDEHLLRQDVLEFQQWTLKRDKNLLIKTILKKFWLIPKFITMLKRLNQANEKFFKERKISVDELRALVTKKEMLLLAWFNREMGKQRYALDAKIDPHPDDVEIEASEINGVPVEWYIPRDHDKKGTIMYIHGGGWCLGSVQEARHFVIDLALRTCCRIVSIDYRLAPEHPFPAGLNDCASVYSWLLSNGFDAGTIIVCGDSAGGNLSLALGMKLKQESTPLPAGFVCLSPMTDLTISDPSFFDKAKTDPVLTGPGSGCVIPYYMGEEDPTNPLVSPVFGDFSGFPPIMFHVSSAEMLHSDSTRAGTRAKSHGVNVITHEWDDMVHDFVVYNVKQAKWPEIEAARKEISAFIFSRL